MSEKFSSGTKTPQNKQTDTNGNLGKSDLDLNLDFIKGDIHVYVIKDHAHISTNI